MKEFYEKFGEVFMLVFNDGNWCVYERENKSFEVMYLRRTKKNSYINGVLVSKEGEYKYPSTNEWGKYGYTCNTLDRAKTIIEEQKATRTLR